MAIAKWNFFLYFSVNKSGKSRQYTLSYPRGIQIKTISGDVSVFEFSWIHITKIKGRDVTEMIWWLHYVFNDKFVFGQTCYL